MGLMRHLYQIGHEPLLELGELTGDLDGLIPV